MDGLALLGILAFVYAAFVFYIAFKRPNKIWNMSKINLFKKVLGDRGTVVFFYIWGILAVVLGIWLVNK